MSEYGQYDELHQYGQQVPGAPPFIPEVTIGGESDEGAIEYDTTADDDNEGRYRWAADDLNAPDTSGIGSEHDVADATGNDIDINTEPETVDLGDSALTGWEPAHTELPNDHPVRFGRHAAAAGPPILSSLVEAPTIDEAPQTNAEDARVLEFNIDTRHLPLEVHERPEADVGDSADEVPPTYPRRVYEQRNVPSGFPDWYEADSKEWRTRPLQGEVPPTDAELAVIDKVNESIIEIGDEVGANMRGALQDPEEHHFFPDKQAYLHGVAMRFGSKTAAVLQNSRGFSHPQAGVAWTRQGNTYDDAFGITHEKMHGVSLEVVTSMPAVQTQETSGPATVQYGVQSLKVGYHDLASERSINSHAATEFATDMATNKSMIMTGVGPIDPTYWPIDILGGHAVLETARAYGLKPLEVENELIKGLWTPDRSGMEKVREVMGDVRFHRFINLDAELTASQARRVAQELGWDYAIEDLAKAHVGQFDAYFGWRRRRYAV
jgi:hypothetical protein